MSKALGRRIKLARTERGMTQQELARAANVKHATISRYESGKLRPTAEVLFRLAHALGKPVGWFLGEKEEQDVLQQLVEDVREIKKILSSYEFATQKVPLLGSVPASDWEAREPTDVKVYIEVPSNIGKADFALLVQGESMSPTIAHGDVVYVRRAKELRHNNIFVVVNEHREATLKRALLKRGEWVLVADNPTYQVSRTESAEVVGVVVGVLRRL